MQRFTSNEIINKLSNRDWDPALEILSPHLDGLIKIIEQSAEPLEGNILFEHHESNFSNGFTKNFFPKRRALTLFSLSQTNLQEIGFNAGFSSLLMLLVNPDLRITALDLCEHKYTRPAYEYIRGIVGDRLKLIEGNSLITLPVINSFKEFSGFHIDGGHGIDIAEADLSTIINNARKNSVICFDDTDFYVLKLMLLKYVMSGSITNIGSDFDIINKNVHMFFRVEK